MNAVRFGSYVARNTSWYGLTRVEIFLRQKLFKRAKIRSSTHAVLFIWLINKPTLASQHAC